MTVITRRIKLVTLLFVFCNIVVASDFKVNGLYYKVIAPTEVEVTQEEDIIEEYDQNIIVVPDYVEHDGTRYQVVRIGSHAFEGKNPDGIFWEGCRIKEIVIQEGVRSIGQYAFNHCHLLNSVSLPNSLKTIEDYAFAGCRSLESISLPGGIEAFGEGVFQGCGFKSLDSVENLRVIGPHIAAHTFASCQQLNSIRIPEWVDDIGEGAFANIPYLQFLYIPKNVKAIGAYTFGEDGGQYVSYEGSNPVEAYNYHYGNPLTVIFDNEDLEIGYQAFGVSGYDGPRSNHHQAPYNMFFLGNKPPIGVGNISHGEFIQPPLVFVPTGLREEYLKSKVISDFPCVGEFEPAIIEEGSSLLTVHLATKGGKVIINGEEISSTQTLIMLNGTLMTIRLVPNEGYVHGNTFWNNNYLDASKGDLADGTFITQLTDHSRLDCFFELSTAISITKMTSGNKVFNLQGQRLESVQRKGIYIQNGKKVVIK